ncbi:mycothiol synthase [Georgenia sp. SYP-B2076]|uniref:mycothiol synthase n=1 Tax=Georgenia sp. SYP-B2076 TaxID=2495881 RepID=UPI0013DF6AE8|nr:mycothiol synthase [Georgenia sp. SYP-B2076]
MPVTVAARKAGNVIIKAADLDREVAPGDILALAEAVAEEDGVPALSEQTLLELRSPVHPVLHLLAVDDGQLVGYAQLDPGTTSDQGAPADQGAASGEQGVAGTPGDQGDGAADGGRHGDRAADGGPDGTGASAELAVHPARRRRGVGRELLDAVRAASPGVSVWAHGNLPGAQALAAAAGMRVVRELLQMAAPLGPLAAATTPGHPGVTVRPFQVGRDEEAWVALNARAFAHHPEQGRMSVADLRAREAEDWFDPALLWLAFPADGPGSAPIASMWVKVLPGEASGEIYALGVDPDAQGRGLGGMLTHRAMTELARRGLRSATLYVEGDNAAALRTYQKEGFRCVSIDVQYR